MHVATCDLTSSLIIGNSPLASGVEFHVSQDEIDQLAAAQGSNSLTFDYDDIIVGDGDFSEFDLTLIAHNSLKFIGISRFASLTAGDTTLIEVNQTR